MYGIANSFSQIIISACICKVLSQVNCVKNWADGQMHWCELRQTCQLHPFDGWTTPFWFISPCFPVRAYNLAVFDVFRRYFLKLLAQNILQYSYLICVLRQFIQEALFKRGLIYTEHIK